MERYGLPEARPPARRGAPDDLRRHPRPHRARRRSRRSRTSPRSTATGSCFADGSVGARPTSSSTAPATRSPSRSSTRTSSRRPTTTCRCSGASSIPTIDDVVLRRAAAAARARSCRSPRRRGSGSPTTSRASTRCRPRARCAADIERRARGDVQALRGLQAPHDAGRLRRLPARARQGAPARRASARARRASRCRCRGRAGAPATAAAAAVAA